MSARITSFGLSLAAALLLPLMSCDTEQAEVPSAPGDGEFLFVPGTTGMDPATGTYADDIAGQLTQTMENIETVLHENGMDLSRAVAVNVFLSDVDDFGAMNEVYRTFFPTAPPTRATVAVDLPDPDALVQVAMIAARPGVTRQVIEPDDLKSPELPYSWGIRAGNTLFLAGATSRAPDTYQPVTGDIDTQTRRVWGNIGMVLNAAGLDYGDLATCTVFIRDPGEFAAMNDAYRQFVTDEPPARATVGAELVNDLFKVEIQCIAGYDTERTVAIAEGASPPSSPFSPAIKLGERVFTAGAVGSSPEGLAVGDIEAQTRQALANLGATLTAADKDFGDVSALYVYVPQIANAEIVGNVLDEVVGTGPARTEIGTALAGPDYLVEIMMIVGAH